jgi:hypothetical protein
MSRRGIASKPIDLPVRRSLTARKAAEPLTKLQLICVGEPGVRVRSNPAFMLTSAPRPKA